MQHRGIAAVFREIPQDILSVEQLGLPPRLNELAMRLTLFYTAPQPPAVWGEEANFENLRECEASAETIIKNGRNAMGHPAFRLCAARWRSPAPKRALSVPPAYGNAGPGAASLR